MFWIPRGTQCLAFASKWAVKSMKHSGHRLVFHSSDERASSQRKAAGEAHTSNENQVPHVSVLTQMER